MKYKKLLCAAIVSLIIAPAVLPAFAAEPQQSDVTIEFKAGESPTPPVKPDEPDEESGETGTGANGPLSIDYISPISFGEKLEISSSEKIYNTVTPKPYLQVTDNRGSGSGWKVTASISSFKKGGADTLRGAYVTLLNGSPLSVNMTPPLPVAEQNIVLDADAESALIITANVGAGKGTWVNRWYPAASPNTYVTLTVPAGTAAVGAHKAIITWALYDAP